ncbi:MAG: DUF5060 domain-containing protein [Armatimonadetes bacterium]|nr:DUF5060 domain-containing protein [Armatimonadota bacterium]
MRYRFFLCATFVCFAIPCLAQLRAEIDPAGTVRAVYVGQRLWLKDIGVTLPKPQWAGNWGDQRDASSVTARAETKGGQTLLIGTMKRDGKRVAFRQRIGLKPEEIRLDYALTPQEDIPVECVLLNGSLPVEGNAGTARWRLSDGLQVREGDFPAKLPASYRLTWAAAPSWMAWVGPQRAGLRMKPHGLAAVGLQDNRQFDIPTFEAQWPARAAGVWKKGDTLRFSMRLRPVSDTEIDREKAAMKPQIVPLAALSSQGKLALPRLAENADPVAQYAKFELTLDLSATYTNPFDPEEIDVTARFTSPSGKEYLVPGFIYHNYTRTLKGGRERLLPEGRPAWKVRFAADTPGRWRYIVTVKDRTGAASSGEKTVTVVRSENRGFIRRSAESRHYLRFDSGKPYFPIGENVSWAGDAGTFDYDTWFKHLGAAGGDFARIWLVYWNMGLEWTDNKVESKSGRGQFYGLGKYSLDNGWRLDYLLDLAARCGVYTMLTVGYHGEVQEAHDFFGSEAFIASPYNAAWGGPCASAADFWTSETARKLYKRKLRYLVARWGWSTQVQSWEFWNEVNAPAPWVAEMARYLRSIDPYRHLITTTYGHPDVWRIPEIDFTQTHHYGDTGNIPDSAGPLSEDCIAHTAQFPKPHLVAEFGIDWRADDGKYDPSGEGVNLHNGIWASALSRGMGGAMIWYWDGYVEPKNLYHHYTALRRFADGIPWQKTNFEIARITDPVMPGGQDRFRELAFTPGGGWGKSPRTQFTVRDNGRIEEGDIVNAYLGSPTKTELSNAYIFHVDYPQDGTFSVRVGTVSSRARLRISVDGQAAFEREYLAGPAGKGPWKSSRFLKEYHVYQSLYDQEETVPVATGKHAIRIENLEGDWIELNRFVFNPYRSSRYANLRALALASPTLALLWVQNRDHTWRNRLDGKPIPPVAGASLELKGLPDGAYRLEWWDTYTGKPFRTAEGVSRSGTLAVAIPEVAKDIACKIIRKEDHP